MNYSEMLHEFLDNSLSSSSEETIFRALAADEELRFEFKSMLKMQNAIKDDEKARMIPVASTNAIFAQLGYTAPAVVGAGGAIAASQSGLLTFLKTSGGYILALCVGALLTSGIFMLSDGTTDTGTQIAEKNAAAAAPVSPSATGPGSTGTLEQQESVVAQSSPQAQSRETARVVNTQSATEQEKLFTPAPQDVENSARTEKAESIPQANETSTSPAEISVLRTDSLAEAAPSVPVQLIDAEELKTEEAPASRSSKVDNEPEIDLDAPTEKKPVAYTASIRTQALAINESIPSQPLPAATDGLENIAFSIGKSVFIEDLTFFIEGGKESYLLTFNEQKRDGRVFQYEVMPSVLWGALGLRYSHYFGDRLSIFGQGSVGGSEAGTLFRGMAGTQFDLTENLGIMLGVEGGTAMYRFQNDTYWSPKYGLKYGITYNILGE